MTSVGDEGGLLLDRVHSTRFDWATLAAHHAIEAAALIRDPTARRRYWAWLNGYVARGGHVEFADGTACAFMLALLLSGGYKEGEIAWSQYESSLDEHKVHIHSGNKVYLRYGDRVLVIGAVSWTLAVLVLFFTPLFHLCSELAIYPDVCALPRFAFTGVAQPHPHMGLPTL